jgi:hypothetical protein
MSKWFLLISFFISHSLAAMEWPLPNANMVSNFGYNDQGRPALGTVFEGEGDILAADGGELIFSCSGKDFASRLPSALGAWSAIDHGDGLVSIYGRYEDQGRVQQPSQVEGGTPIAKAGSSGWSGRNGLYFQLFDRKERRWVNASMVITPFPDTVPPQILGMQLRNAQNQVDNRLMTNVQLRISQGRYIIEVNTIDTLMNIRGVPLAPHRILCSVNGVEVGVLSFETINARDGMLMVSRNGLVPASQVYANYPVLEVGEVQLNRGQAILEVIVQDITGNSRNAQARMIVE